MSIPKDVAERVVKRIFADMIALDWENLSLQERTRQYAAWAGDPDVGGVLGQFKEDPRRWIKDGPVKEWTRAKIGIGPYASFMESLTVVANPVGKIIRLALGEGWAVNPEEVKPKPFRVIAHDEGYQDPPVLVCWSEPKGFKYLLWAAMNAYASGDYRQWILVVYGTFEKPVPPDEKAKIDRIARRCRLDVRHIEL